MTHSAQLRVLALLAAAVALVAALVVTQRSADGLRIQGRIGPTPGPNSTGHIQTQRAYLDRLAASSPEAQAAGLVSFSRFVTAGEAAALIEGMEATAVFVRFPQEQPDALVLSRPMVSTVAARAREIAAAVREEVEGLERQLAAAPPEQRALLETSLTRRREALAQIGPDCACVYAAGAQGTTVAALARLQQRSEVALVDVPRPLVADLKGWQLTPIVPAQRA